MAIQIHSESSIRKQIKNNNISNSSSSSPSLSSSCCEYKLLRYFCVAVTCCYVTLLIVSGNEEKSLLRGVSLNSRLSRLSSSWSSSSSNSSSSSSSEPSSSALESESYEADEDAPTDDSESDSDSHPANNDSSSTTGTASTHTDDLKKYNGVDTIILLGERHSGTNWITDHLTACFQDDIRVTNDYARFKHWFQTDDLERVPPKSALVISMFRDPYDWVEAMRERPHHAHDHMGLDWRSFVTKPWVGQRGRMDREIERGFVPRRNRDNNNMRGGKDNKNHNNNNGGGGGGGTERPGARENYKECMDHYSFNEIIPCSPEDSPKLEGYGEYKYELNHDGSEKPYSSIIDLRKHKIVNHLSVKGFEGTKAYFPYRYEDLNFNGTRVLLEDIEGVLGIKAKCEPLEGTGVVKHKDVEKEYVTWMNRYVNWGVEMQIGYVRR